jgi:mannose-6-phosphate isomerase-like protein (cupin superfamily)
MAETKYGKYIITEPKPNFWNEEGAQKDGPDTIHPTVYIDDKVIDGAFYTECNWFWKANQYSPPVHTHSFDEVLAFIGTNPENPQDLCGEVELWLDDEQHFITKTSLVYIPAGLKHCPMLVRKLDRPIFHFSVGTSGNYNKDKVK